MFRNGRNDNTPGRVNFKGIIYTGMTFNDFIALDETSQEEVLAGKRCVWGRDEGKFKVLLYQLSSFYVEVYYHKEHKEIKKLLPFEDTDLLAPYLNKIDISELID